MHQRMRTSVGLLFALTLMAPRPGLADENTVGYRAVIVGRWGREQNLGVFGTWEQASHGQ